MKKFALAVVFGLFAGQAMALAPQPEVKTVLECDTNLNLTLKVTWEPTTGKVNVIHGNYSGVSNTNDMGWNKAVSSEAEDTEMYYHKGDFWTTLFVTDTGAMKQVGIKQTKGSPDNITNLDSCTNIRTLDVTAPFLENMTYVDDE